MMPPGPAAATVTRLRWANMADGPAIERLMELAIGTLQAGFLSPEQVAASRAFMGLDIQLIEDGTFLLAEQGDAIVGCGGWSLRATLYGGSHSASLRDPARLDPATDAARIRAMYTHPAFARRGIGRLVLQACERAAAQAGFGCAELMATLSGEPLYAATGYHQVERLASQSDGVIVPLVRMRKTLPPTS